ncbi:MAG: hypothetical protein MI750_03670 [Xanthomonadales bacterium]|nr:hypothetical protein [Xanthomonadales bacterium]
MKRFLAALVWLLVGGQTYAQSCSQQLADTARLEQNTPYIAGVCPASQHCPFVDNGLITEESTLLFASGNSLNNKIQIPEVVLNTFPAHASKEGINTTFYSVDDPDPNRWTGCFPQPGTAKAAPSNLYSGQCEIKKDDFTYWRLTLTGVHKNFTQFAYRIDREDYPPEVGILFTRENPPPICDPTHKPKDPEVGSGTAMGTMMHFNH